MRLDCLLTPADIASVAPERLRGVACVVFDVLRATSTIVTAMARGAREVRPVLSLEEAREAAAQWPGAKLAGERHGDRIAGFDFGNSPLEFARSAPERLVTTTTNGTVALRACAGADTVFAAALLNLASVTARLRAEENVLLVCAGTFETAALEDIYAAGALAAALPGAELTDAAATALAVFGRYGEDARQALADSRNGQVLAANGRGAEVDFCAQRDRWDIVPQMRAGVLQLTPDPGSRVEG